MKVPSPSFISGVCHDGSGLENIYLCGAWNHRRLGVHNRHMGGPMRARRWVAICLIVALLVVPVVVYSQAVPAVAIWGVTTAGAAWTAASELVLTVRAALAAPMFYSAATWVASTLVPAAASLVVPMCLVGGVTLGAAGLAWIAAKGYGYVNGVISSIDLRTGILPEHLAAIGFEGGPGTDGYYYTKIWSDHAQQECEAVGCNRGIKSYLGWTYWEHQTDSNHRTQYHPLDTVPQSTPMTDEAVRTQMEMDLVSPDAEIKEKAQAAVLEMMAAITQAFNEAKTKGTWPPAALPGQNPIPQSQWDVWENALKAGISETDKTAMEAQDIAENYGKDAVNPPILQVGLTTGMLTQGAVKEAVKEGIKEADDALTSPSLPETPGAEATPSAPEKESLTAALSHYTDGLGTLPIIGILTGAQLSISGSDPVLTLPLAIGESTNNITVDFSEYQTILDLIGTMLLTWVGISWIMWLFMGRGD